MDYGFRVVISSRFADIFRGNSAKGGLLAAQVAQPDVELLWKLLENQPGTEVTVDLRREDGAGRGPHGAVRHRRLHPLAAAGRPGRHRPDPAARRRRSPPSRRRRPARLPTTIAPPALEPVARRTCTRCLDNGSSGGRAPSYRLRHEQVPARGRAGRRASATGAPRPPPSTPCCRSSSTPSGPATRCRSPASACSRAGPAPPGTGRNPRTGETRRGAGDDRARVPARDRLPQRGRRRRGRAPPRQPRPRTRDAAAAPSAASVTRARRRTVRATARPLNGASRPDVGAHHDAAGRARRAAPADDEAGQGAKKAAPQEGGHEAKAPKAEEAAQGRRRAKKSARSRRPRPTRRAGPASKAQEGQVRRLRGAQPVRGASR